MFQSATQAEITALVDAAIVGLPVAVRDAHRTVVTDGSAHVVVLLADNAAVRITRDKFTGESLKRRQALVDSIPTDFGFAVPRSLGPIVEIDGYSAVATEFVSGSPSPIGDGEPAELDRLVSAMSSIAPEPRRNLLVAPLAFCGGADWYRIQVDEVIPRIESSVRELAKRAIDDLAGLESVRSVFAHGDLGGHNVMWSRGRVVGVVDWDLGSESDRSTDLASLGVWHGWHKLAEIATAEDVRRANVRRNTFRLQQVGFLSVANRTSAEIDAAALQASEWIRKNLS